MTPDQRDACLALVRRPGGGRPLSPRRFRRRVGTRDGEAWAGAQVLDAVEPRHEDDLELALVAAAVLGVGRESHDALVRALDGDWHHSHETVLGCLEGLASPADVPALLRATARVPAYLELDESRALARKAIHLVSRIPGPEADAAWQRLAGHEDDALARLACRLLDSRRGGPRRVR